MKIKLASLIVLAAVLAAFSSSLTAAPKTDHAIAARVRTAHFNSWEISRGASAQILVNRFGLPDTKLSENVWVYQRFHVVQNHAQIRGCSTLIVTLVDGVVRDLFMVNERAQALITARLQSGVPIFVASGR